MKQSMMVLTSSESNEWYTPQEYIDAVRECLGCIDLDPSSCEVANSWIQAKTFYTIEQDGLSLPWFGHVFLNPPYGKTANRSNQDIWSKHLEFMFLRRDVKAAILLTKCTPGYAWWEYLFERWPVCFCSERIRFVQADNSGIMHSGQAKSATNFWLFTDFWTPRNQYATKFQDVFQQFGRIIFPYP